MAKFKDCLQKPLLWASPWEVTVSVGKLETTFLLPDELSGSYILIAVGKEKGTLSYEKKIIKIIKKSISS